MTIAPSQPTQVDSAHAEDLVHSTPVLDVQVGQEAAGEPGVPSEPLPRRIRFSGLYAGQRPAIPRPSLELELDEADPELPVDGDDGLAASEAAAAPPWPLRLSSEELRLDVDGHDPQMTASGTVRRGTSSRVHWIASLARTGRRSWRGTIWYKEGDVASLPQTDVTIVVWPRPASVTQRARVVFTGGAPRRTATFNYVSPAYHRVELEFDATADAAPVTSIKTCGHPNHPATLPCEDLSIEAVYRRTGFDVRTSTGSGSVVPLTIAGQNADPRWADNEMHDAMQTYWSRFSNQARWAMWVFWARQHETGPGLGGVMFDDIGPNHRQGTAIFTDSFIAVPPNGETSPAAWVDRMKFWTAVHEIGHGFNLAHSWQKEHPPAWGTPWIPLANDTEARSFMNYPYNVGGGEGAFFGDFEYRFGDPELLFMRHAPESFVRMGDADWFVDHGFEAPPDIGPPSSLVLTVRANRPVAAYDFLEPVVLELKLTNAGSQPVVVDRRTLASDQVVAVVERRGHRARQWVPYARYCLAPEPTTLAPGQSLYEPLPVYVGRNGWDISEPGIYRVRVGLDLDEQSLVSDALTVKVRPPAAALEEHLAQDLFSDAAGRALAVGGTVVMASAISALEAVVERAPDSRAALHAEATLAAPLTVAYKVLHVPDHDGAASSVGLAGGEVRTRPPSVDEAAERLQAALINPGPTAAETFGHVGYHRRVDQLTSFLDREGDPTAAARAEGSLREVLTARAVLPQVIDEISERERAFEHRADAESAG
jgi:hypothetical protein